MSEPRLEPLRRFVARQHLWLLAQLPLWGGLAWFLLLVAEHAYRRNVVGALFTILALAGGISFGARHTARGLRLARCCVASGAPDLARRAALGGGISAVLGALTLVGVLAVISVRHSDELLSNLPSSEKVKGVALRLVLCASIVWMARAAWRALRWRSRWSQLEGHLPPAPEDRLLWAMFSPLYALWALKREGLIHPQEPLLYASSDNVFLTGERLIYVPMIEDEGGVAAPVSLPRAEVLAVESVGTGIEYVTASLQERCVVTEGGLLGRPGPLGLWDAFVVHWDEPSLEDPELGQLISYLTTGKLSAEAEEQQAFARLAAEPLLAPREELVEAVIGSAPRGGLSSEKDPATFLVTAERLVLEVVGGELQDHPAEGAWLVGLGKSDEDAQDVILDGPGPGARLTFRSDFLGVVLLLRALVAHRNLSVVYRPHG